MTTDDQDEFLGDLENWKPTGLANAPSHPNVQVLPPANVQPSPIMFGHDTFTAEDELLRAHLIEHMQRRWRGRYGC